MNNIIDEVVAIGGSMFPFTPFKKTNSKVKIIHGDADQRRPWEYVKKTYEDKYEIGKEIKLL